MDTEMGILGTEVSNIPLSQSKLKARDRITYVSPR